MGIRFPSSRLPGGQFVDPNAFVRLFAHELAALNVPPSAPGGDGTGLKLMQNITNEDGGGGPPKPPPLTWANKYTVEGAPSWWRGMVPSRLNAQTEYATILNSLVPYMSPEDQRYTASVLYRLYPAGFGKTYDAERTPMEAPPAKLTTEERREMVSADRANQMLATLSKVRKLGGAKGAGPGYKFLRQVATAQRDFGAKEGEGQTRQQYSQMAGALDPLIAETKGEKLSAFSELTRMITQPFYTAGKVTPTSELENGKTVFGESISNYY